MRLIESGSSACRIHMYDFVEMSHNRRNLCLHVCLTAGPVQSDLQRADGSMMGVRAHERVVLRVCVAAGGGGNVYFWFRCIGVLFASHE